MKTNMIEKTQTFTYGNTGEKVSFTIDPKLTTVLVKCGPHKIKMRKSDLWQLAFMISKQKDQDELIPIEKRPMMKFMRIFKVQARKDMKAGEVMEFHTEIDVPLMVVDQLLKEHGVELKDVIKPEELVIPSTVDNTEKEGV